MAEHLTEKEVKTAVRLIEGWEGKLTWQKLIDKLTAETGRSEAPTRQTLYSHENIATAWHAIKHRVKNKSPRAPSLAMADNMIERRDATNLILEAQVARYEEQFMRWLYNAGKRGVSIKQLNEALPKKPINSTEE